MKDQDPRRTARRTKRQQQREDRGIAVPACALCIEDHHTAGRRHDAQLTAPLCEVHHRAIHERMRRAGISLTREPNKLKRVAKALRSAASYNRELGDAMDRWADTLDHMKGKGR
jgi:hypothetical protein